MSGGLKRLVPLMDRVLVSRVEPLKKTVGGVILPDSAVSKVNEGTVVAVGPGARTSEGNIIPMSVKEGDTVLLPEYGGTQVKIDDKDFTLYRDSELLGLMVG
ncbi:10 kDa chaperonin [Chloropicon roscoffensis]|uniref:Protein groES n=1 Tax=Chloropicon roscoffensis TaxID=1461544 RepID=A0AAX4PET8_9CHLO